MNLSQVGLIGLGVMGKNLALNIARHGFSVCGHDLAPEAVDAFTALGGQAPEGAPVRGADDLSDVRPKPCATAAGSSCSSKPVSRSIRSSANFDRFSMKAT